MHPSRLVSLCCAGVGVLFVSQTAVGSFQLDLEHGWQLFGGAALVVASLYAAVRYETEPIVTEYGPTTYLLVGVALAWIGTLAARLALGLS